MKKLLAIVGPTGSGKTALGIKLAKIFSGEVVSADSRQIYLGMDIGTGKVSEDSKLKKGRGRWVVDDIAIYLYDIVSPEKKFSVADHQQLAYKTIKNIQERGKLPILVGGTGLYIRAVLEGLNIPKVAPDKKLRAELESKSLTKLFRELKKADPKEAEKIDKNNPRRLVRALEVFYKTGERISDLKTRFKTDFDSLQIGLTADRDYLYEKVDKRIDEWFEKGFVEEVKNLIGQGFSKDLPSMSSLGYRQVRMYLEGKISLDEAKQRMKWEHHSYIRRQLTWFRRDPAIHWFDINEEFTERVVSLISDWIGRLPQDEL